MCLYPKAYPLFYESYLKGRDLDMFAELDVDERYLLPELPERCVWFRTIKFLLKDREDFGVEGKKMSKQHFIDLYVTENGEMTGENVKIFNQPRPW